ncbi:MAG: tRNA (adenosine(37)-N6)-dimethylallyltransferase MiaA [Spirochaetales bacterium]
MQSKKPKVLLIGGPTAVGKTSLGIECAKLFHGEIISADCVQVYKGLNIGSAKPTTDELSSAKHHLIDVLEPTESFNVDYFKNSADELIKKLNSEGKLPIIVGGTGLYMRALLFPYDLGKSERNEEIRQKYKKLAEEHGKEYVYNILKEVDEESANKLHFNDLKRVIRALEIYEVSGNTKSSHKTNELVSDYDYTLVALIKDRKTLYEQINKRVDMMFENGLLEEVTDLVKNKHLTRDLQSMNAIGYKEFFDYFDGKITLEQVKENIKQNSRRYAKRQITWFKTMPNVHFFETDEGISKVLDFLKGLYYNQLS